MGTGNNAIKGVITSCTDTAFSFSSYTNENSYSDTKEGWCHGNGTVNPIMGYSIQTNSGTCIETAQMK